MRLAIFIGFVPIGTALAFPVLTEIANVPTDSSTTPTYRVYGNSQLMTAGTGSLTSMESAAVTGATNATPIVITSVNHGLTTGMKITVASVGGNTAANGVWTITRVNADAFSLDTSVGNGAYTSGGTWRTTGYYLATITPTTGNGYAQGEYYDVLVVANVGGNVIELPYRFGVI